MEHLTKESFIKVTGGYVCHFMEVLTDKENTMNFKSSSDIFGVDSKYKFALSKVKKLGGKMYHNFKYGGGIKFITADLESLIQSIAQLN